MEEKNFSTACAGHYHSTSRSVWTASPKASNWRSDDCRWHIMERKQIDPVQRSWENLPGELPKPLRILVFRTGQKAAPYHAMCVQFAGIDARGQTEIEAVHDALDLLLNYLHDWYVDGGKGWPTRKVEQVYEDLFDFGKTRRDLLTQLKENLPVRVLIRRHKHDTDEVLLIREANARELELADAG